MKDIIFYWFLQNINQCPIFIDKNESDIRFILIFNYNICIPVFDYCIDYNDFYIEIYFLRSCYNSKDILRVFRFNHISKND